jgi:hypothetical protein
MLFILYLLISKQLIFIRKNISKPIYIPSNIYINSCPNVFIDIFNDSCPNIIIDIPYKKHD